MPRSRAEKDRQVCVRPSADTPSTKTDLSKERIPRSSRRVGQGGLWLMGYVSPLGPGPGEQCRGDAERKGVAREVHGSDPCRGFRLEEGAEVEPRRRSTRDQFRVPADMHGTGVALRGVRTPTLVAGDSRRPTACSAGAWTQSASVHTHLVIHGREPGGWAGPGGEGSGRLGRKQGDDGLRWRLVGIGVWSKGAQRRAGENVASRRRAPPHVVGSGRDRD